MTTQSAAGAASTFTTGPDGIRPASATATIPPRPSEIAAAIDRLNDTAREALARLTEILARLS